MRPRIGAVAVLGLVLAATACAGGAGPTASPSPAGSPTSAAPTGSPDPGSPAPGGSALTIVVDDGTGTITTWTLTCQPVGGDHPDPAGACTALDENRRALSPVPKGKMCAQVYGGPEKATISGVWDGQQIMASLSRTDACETARWDALVPLVPSGGR